MGRILAGLMASAGIVGVALGICAVANKILEEKSKEQGEKEKEKENPKYATVKVNPDSTADNVGTDVNEHNSDNKSECEDTEVTNCKLDKEETTVEEPAVEEPAGITETPSEADCCKCCCGCFDNAEPESSEPEDVEPEGTEPEDTTQGSEDTADTRAADQAQSSVNDIKDTVMSEAEKLIDKAKDALKTTINNIQDPDKMAEVVDQASDKLIKAAYDISETAHHIIDTVITDDVKASLNNIKEKSKETTEKIIDDLKKSTDNDK